MKRASWLTGLRTAMAIRQQPARHGKRRSNAPTRRKIAAFELLEERHLLANPEFTSASAISVPENTITVMTVTAFDPDQQVTLSSDGGI